MWKGALALTCLSSLFTFATAHGVPWIAADWDGQEPQFPPGSLFWKTNEYPRCPMLYRTMLEVSQDTITAAGFRISFSDFAYIFLNGQQTASFAQRDVESRLPRRLDVELSHLLKPGRNVLIISTSGKGFSLQGRIGYTEGSVHQFASDSNSWKVQKLPPLTMLEFEPFMQSDFDDSRWFPVKETEQEQSIPDDELVQIISQLGIQRLEKLDKDARWRLNMLISRGIAVVDWEAYGWAGPARLPGWVIDAARQVLETDGEPGWHSAAADALTWYVRLSDDAVNMENYVVGLKALKAPVEHVNACENAAKMMHEVLGQMEPKIRDGKYPDAVEMAAKGKTAIEQARSARIINDLCWGLDNKFGWLDTSAMMDNDVAAWGLQIDSSVEVFASPLSPAALITANETEFTISGWNDLEPLKVYNKPANLGPVSLWAVIDGKVTGLKPGEDGVVYDQAVNGELSENWAVLVNDLSAGGHLPIELVFLESPVSTAFKAGEKGTSEVTVTFDKPGARFFILRPLKEWRGLLQQARVLKDDPEDGNQAQRYIKQFRFWSQVLLNYPVTFSEVFVRDPEDRRAILVADVYNYWEQEDEWGTEPIRIAPLPPLATYGLMMEYPGLEVVGEAENLDSRGVWGDHIAAVGKDYIVYRIPIDPIKRFGGFTSYCFGWTDIGQPGSITEIETIKRTGANTFRPQHNQTGEPAMKTLNWCWERGIQNVFNTDEKWVPDVCEHFRRLAQQCKDYPPDAVAYDLLNEPETRDPIAYDALIRKITAAIREIDKTHLIYVEVFPPWGPSASPFPRAAFENLKPTGDEPTCYSFHDYEFRLPPRWPNDEHDIRDIIARWIPAFKFGIDSRRPIHLGEFGGFEQTEQSVYDNPCALTMMMDYLRIFDQFGWHWHYYANRGTVRVRRDGSLQDSYVQDAYRRYFSRGTFNVNR
jgi:hypothetical protein